MKVYVLFPLLQLDYIFLPIQLDYVTPTTWALGLDLCKGKGGWYDHLGSAVRRRTSATNTWAQEQYYYCHCK